MAVVTPTITYAPDGQRNAVRVVWESMANGDTGAPFSGWGLRDGSVQIEGTFGVGGSITMQLSNDATNWQAAADPQGNDVTKTAADLETLLDIVGRQIRPNVTAGDGTTALTVTLFGVR